MMMGSNTGKPTFQRTTNNSNRAGTAAALTFDRRGNGIQNKNGKNSSSMTSTPTQPLPINSGIASAVKAAINTSLPKAIQEELVQAVTTAVEAVLATHFDTIRILQEKLHNQELQLQELQQYSRRNNLRIYGVPETQKDVVENTDQALCNIFKEKLGVEIKPREICRSHRVGKHRNNTNDDTTSCARTPRPIIVKFVSYNAWSRVFREKKQLKGTGITIREDLTLHNVRLLAQAREKYGSRSVWTMDGRIILIDPATGRKTAYQNLMEEQHKANSHSFYSQVD